jgi:acetylornithine deacetylase/succinyl-diaminopimelate desuccinylase-like protein
MFAPIAERVRTVTSEVARDRISEYVAGLVAVPGGRHIAQPGNAPAADWVADRFRSFGFVPERHDFTAQGLDLQNVLVTVPGTTNPELVYVVGAHFDAVRNAPGADDDATGIAVVLEAARTLRDNPQPATIVFMAFNGEEAGLFGARAWVGDQVEAGTKVMGFINHEVIGWANDHRMDNTIRHNNDDLRDATHAAAFLFSRLITYDSYYVRSTDAAIFHDAYGEIVTALAGFPLLGNPHYHQPSDDVRTIDMQLVAEGAKTTIATVMLMASSPAPLKEPRVERRDGARAEVAWTASPERDVVSYSIRYGPASDPEANEITVDAAAGPRATLPDAPTGTVVKLRANGRDGMHGWGWARLTVE